MENRVSLGSIQKTVWDGRIPLEIVLASSESRTFDRTDPYLVCPLKHSARQDANPLCEISYPRISYLPSLLPKLRAFFSNSLIEPDSQPHDGWLEFEGVPLKWHYPVGLLFDLYAGADPASKTTPIGDESPERVSPLPWKLVVHFRDWPDEELVRLDADGMVMNDAFINSVKEADFLRNGTAKGIMSLSKEDSSGLWKAVEDGT
jgi:autophagy-related protein 5